MRLARCRFDTATLARVRDRGGVAGPSWTQFGDDMLLYGPDADWSSLTRSARAQGAHFEESPASVREDALHLVVQKGRLFQREHPDVPVLLDKGRFLVVEMDRDRARQLTRDEPCYSIGPLPENRVVFDVVAVPPVRVAVPAWVGSVVERLDRLQFEADVRHLVDFRTRHSLSPEYDTAARWARQQFIGMGYAARLETITVGSATSRNVVSDRMGSGAVRDLVLVVAHLDSVNLEGGAGAPAPGADDNASGSAGVLAIARALRAHAPSHDVRFVLFGGEEQGLHGSQQHVAALSDVDRARLRAVVNMDMVGSRNTPEPSVLLEGAPVSQGVIHGLAEAAAAFTSLTVQRSLEPFASDHVPFINAGLAAVLTIEGADGANDSIHTAEDTLDQFDFDLAHAILRMNVGYVARAVGQHGGLAMSDRPSMTTGTELASRFRVQYSGRYHCNGGVIASGGPSAADADISPIHDLASPVLVDPPATETTTQGLLKFTLHIDIDGTDPLGVVSGALARGPLPAGTAPPHFIGQVTSNTPAPGGGRSLVVENFSFSWPDTGEVANRVEVQVSGALTQDPTADVVFVTNGGRREGPFTATQASPFFRDIELEVDREDDALDPEPYDTHTHPDRPTDLTRESLTLESAFAKAGLRVTRSSGTNTVATSAAGAGGRWLVPELHDAMQLHWSAFANQPQWKMWIFLAELAQDDPIRGINGDGLGGIMFDSDIGDPAAVDRQGTALFTKCPFFHLASGGYPQANPPADEAATRELFFNLIHETGHAFNLFHSFQKALQNPWGAPPWMPITPDASSLSWMNYPDQATPGLGANATWFYDRFRFTFDAGELLFLRHAPSRFVQMGNAAWGHDHGRAIRGLVDRRLEMDVRAPKDVFELGEPVSVEVKLSNVSDQTLVIHDNLGLHDGYVRIAVTDPKGVRRPFLPLAATRGRVQEVALEPGAAIYANYTLAYSTVGTPFTDPGAYRVEAAFTNQDGGMAAAVMRLYVRPADFEALPVIHDLFNARVGRTIMMGGSRVMEDALERVDRALRKLGPKHPAQFKLAEARVGAFATPFKLVDPRTKSVKVADPDPDLVVKDLKSVVDMPVEAADSVGHIGFSGLIQIYTECAVAAGNRNKAKSAQKDMIALFKRRKVVPRAIKAAEERLKTLS